MATIWRLHIKTDADGVDPGVFCIEQKILGIGWAVEPDADHLDWDTYNSRGKEQYCKSDTHGQPRLNMSDYREGKGWWAAIHALKDKIQVNDLCWTRTRNGKYWLGRITGEWEYRNPPEFKRADLV